MSSSTENVQYLQIPLQHILLATNQFADQNIIGRGGYGNVYKCISKKHGCMAIKRLVHWQSQGDHQFRTEIALLSKHKHENIVSLLGFCDEEGEMILVYRYESNGSLDKHLGNQHLTWIHRLLISLHVARGLNHLHDEVGRGERIYHRDVKSSNILLDESWNPKISDFGLSRVSSASTMSSFVITNPCGTLGYIDPDYRNKGYLTQKADVYSFGVVLWEVLCGRLAIVKDEHVDLSLLAEKHHQKKTLDRIIPQYLHKQMNTDSLDKFSDIAYQCLKKIEERPTMKEVVEQLKEALHNQLEFMSPDDGKRVEKQANPATGDEKKRKESKDPPSPPLPQEFAFQVFLHCDECARQVRRCVKELEGVEDVVTDCATHMVVVKGEKADPLKILERIRKKTGRKVKLLSPVLNPTMEEAIIKMEQEEPFKPEEKKDEEVMKPENSGKKVKEEANPAAGDEKKRRRVRQPTTASPAARICFESIHVL
ncbi:putative serine/threonine-protein kinase PBL28 [Bidens hawaiensis]|uniref:putative serine/threonine-protein kinase PBL28 n=1 Tax=Bidens hawaiensis TaxID=980011 RepID=UPI00404B636C